MAGVVLMRRRAFARGAWLALAVSLPLLFARESLADDAASSPERLVVESYVGSPPEAADRLLPTVRQALRDRGYGLGDAAARQLPDRLPRRNEPPERRAVVEVQDFLDRGFRHWHDVEFSSAIETLDRAIRRAREHPRMAAESSALRGRLFRAHIALSLAHRRSGDATAAREVMAEVVRSFADREIPFSEFGPEPEEIRRDVRDELGDAGMARLRVLMRGETARALFVNERFVGAGEEVEVELYPGDYRVFAVTDDGVGRVYRVGLDPDEAEELVIDPAFESALRVRERPALVFPDDETRKRLEDEYALNLARAANATAGAVVLSLREGDEGRVLYGKTLSYAGGAELKAHLPAGADVPAGDLRDLGTFLAGAPPTTAVTVHEAQRPTGAPQSDVFGPWSWMAIGAGIPLVSGGIGLWALDEPGACWNREDTCSRLTETRTTAIAVTALGATSVAAGALAWLYDSRRSGGGSSLAARVVPTAHDGFSVIFSGEF